MKILIYGINYYPELTSTGKYTGDMAQWLAGRGHRVRVVTAPPYYPAWMVAKPYSAWRYCRETHGEFADGEIEVFRCPLWVPARPSGLKRILHLLSFALSSFPVIIWQAIWKPDVVWVVAPTLLCAPGAWLSARFGGAKAWLHIQDFELDVALGLSMIHGGWVSRAFSSLENWILRRFDRVSTISAPMATLLRKKTVEGERIVLFPNWVDTARVRPVSRLTAFRAELGMTEDTIVVLYSGNLGEKQGLEHLIAAARELGDSDSSNEIADPECVVRVEPRVEFVICGDGVAKTRLRCLARGLTNLHWLAVQPECRLNELLSTADIHVLPQLAGAADLVMPSKLTAMLASGKPVIASAQAGTEVHRVVQGRGVLVPPGSVESLSGAIRELARDAERRRTLGELGRAYAEENLDRKSILERFNQCLHASLADKSAEVLDRS